MEKQGARTLVGGSLRFEEPRGQMSRIFQGLHLSDAKLNFGPKKKAARRTRHKSVRPRASELTKERILQAATEEFASRGYEGARVDRIAHVAKANKNLLYHYFGGKEPLFTAVLHRTYALIRQKQRQVEIEGQDPVATMRRLVNAISDIWLEFPEFGRLLDSENLQQAKHIKTSREIPSMYTPLLSTIDKILSQGVSAGIFKRGVDPIDLYISMSALMAYYLSHRHTFEAIFSTKLLTKDRLQQRRRHIVDVVLAYLRP